MCINMLKLVGKPLKWPHTLAPCATTEPTLFRRAVSFAGVGGVFAAAARTQLPPPAGSTSHRGETGQTEGRARGRRSARWRENERRDCLSSLIQRSPSSVALTVITPSAQIPSFARNVGIFRG